MGKPSFDHKGKGPSSKKGVDHVNKGKCPSSKKGVDHNNKGKGPAKGSADYGHDNKGLGKRGGPYHSPKGKGKKESVPPIGTRRWFYNWEQVNLSAIPERPNYVWIQHWERYVWR